MKCTMYIHNVLIEIKHHVINFKMMQLMNKKVMLKIRNKFLKIYKKIIKKIIDNYDIL